LLSVDHKFHSLNSILNFYLQTNVGKNIRKKTKTINAKTRNIKVFIVLISEPKIMGIGPIKTTPPLLTLPEVLPVKAAKIVARKTMKKPDKISRKPNLNKSSTKTIKEKFSKTKI